MLNLKKRNALIAGIAGAALLPMAAMAQDSGLSYNWVEVDYLNLDIDGIDDNEDALEDFNDGAGFAVRGSYALPFVTPGLFIEGSYSSTDAEADYNDANNAAVTREEKIKRLDAKVGYAVPLQLQSLPDTHWVSKVGYVDVDYGDFDFGAGGTQDSNSFQKLDEDKSDGFTIDTSFRSQLTPNLEGSVGLRYTDIEAADGISLIGNVMYEITPNWGLNAEIDAGDELGTYLFGVRYSK